MLLIVALPDFLSLFGIVFAVSLIPLEFLWSHDRQTVSFPPPVYREEIRRAICYSRRAMSPADPRQGPWANLLASGAGKWAESRAACGRPATGTGSYHRAQSPPAAAFSTPRSTSCALPQPAARSTSRKRP